MIYVVAGNLQQAHQFSASLPHCAEWRYISTPEQLYGVEHNFNIVFVGTWWENENANRIKAYVSALPGYPMRETQTGRRRA
jgi:hypothetical protein